MTEAIEIAVAVCGWLLATYALNGWVNAERREQALADKLQSPQQPRESNGRFKGRGK